MIVSRFPVRRRVRQVGRRLGLVLGLTLAAPLVLSARPARAFQDPPRFAMPSIDAGGGGRFFTGSPADGFRCTVCHKGHNVAVRIAGLPDATYTPGNTYRLAVTWSEPVQPVGLNAEITDRDGRTAGTVAAVPMDQLTDADLCLGMPAAGIFEAMDEAGMGTRQVVISFACGAKRVAVDWTAPAMDVGPVWFAGSLVASDEQGTLDGDGVADFARVIGSPSVPDPLAAEIGGQRSCALSHRASRPRWSLPIAAIALASLLTWRRRRTRIR